MTITDPAFLSYLSKCTQEKDIIPLRQILEIWIEITGLEASEALNLSASKILEDLHIGSQVLTALAGVIKNDDQLREMICRKIGTFTISQGQIREGDFTHNSLHTVTWNGSVWCWVSDPRTRLRAESTSLQEAIQQMRESRDF